MFRAYTLLPKVKSEINLVVFLKHSMSRLNVNLCLKHNLKFYRYNSNLSYSVLNKKNVRFNCLYCYFDLSKYFKLKNVELSHILKSYCTRSYDLQNLVNNPKVKKYMENLMLEYKMCVKNDLTSLSKKIPQFIKTSKLLENKAKLEDNISSLEELALSEHKDSQEDNELTQLVKEEKTEYTNKIKCLNMEILKSLIPKPPLEDCNGIVMEITAGVGGQEAMLFAKDLYTMYCGYIGYRGWTMDLADIDATDIGGIRHVSFLVYGKEVYKHLNTEGGVHRVQRIPLTEKYGRLHTSTVTVAVFPQPEEVDVVLNDKDLKIETKRASGAGGQHVNTTDSAIRIIHIPTGVAVECQKERSQIKNKQVAMHKLRAKLFEIQINEQQSEIKSSRKSQVGTSGRSEKVRTYNFNQDRITDHRLSSNAHHLTTFLQGGEPLHRLIQQLLELQEQERIVDFVQNITV